MPDLTQLEARQRGRALLKKMKGKGWKLRVWENLGWHYSVILLGMAVYEDSAGEYSVLLSNRKESSGGEMYWTLETGRRHRDPNAAVRAQMKLAQAFERRTTHNLEALRKALAG